MQRQRGLTLLELMVVLLIIGFATAGVALALRDSSQTQLEREAQRLVAKLEAGRAQSRTSGQTLVTQDVWLQANTQVTIDVPANASATGVVLGPEPILSPIQITLRIQADKANASTLRIGTNGLKPFEVLP
jgi:general secretion pathway protein H